jgi:hypothetical protein
MKSAGRRQIRALRVCGVTVQSDQTARRIQSVNAQLADFCRRLFVFRLEMIQSNQDSPDGAWVEIRFASWTRTSR